MNAELQYGFPNGQELVLGRKTFKNNISIIASPTGGNQPSLFVQALTGGPAINVLAKGGQDIIRIGMYDGNTSPVSNYISTQLSVGGTATFDITSGGGTGSFSFSKALSATALTGGTVGTHPFTTSASATSLTNAAFAFGNNSKTAAVLTHSFYSTVTNSQQTVASHNWSTVIVAKSTFITPSTGSNIAANFVVLPLGTQNSGGGTTDYTAALLVDSAAASTVNFSNYALWVGGTSSANRIDGTLILSDSTTTAPATKLHVISTTEQVRTAYDATNYLSTTVSSTGSATFQLTGTSPTFTFSRATTFSNTVAINGNLSQNGISTTFRTTNAGANITAGIAIGIDGTASVAGNISIYIDPTTHAFNFSAGNGTRSIARAQIGLTNLNNTAGSEAGDLTFYTQTAGAAATEKLRITGGGTTVLSAPLRLKNYTVSTLPAGTQGDVAFVTDALAPSYLVAVTGGGAIVTPVFYNGTNWVAY